MMRFKAQGKPLGDEDPNLVELDRLAAELQADSDSRDRTQTSSPEDSNESKTRLEPYPRMLSVEQDEAIAWLKGVVAGLDKRLKALEDQNT